MEEQGEGGGGARQDQTHVTTAVGGTAVDGRAAEPFLEQAARALAADDWAAAEEAFALGVAESPLDARLHGGLALVAIQGKDWDRAVSHGRQASVLPGATVEVHNNLGWSLEQRGDIEEALKAYGEAFSIDPVRPEPIHHLVRLGSIPLSEGEEEGPPAALETLQRLELYRHLVGFMRDGESGLTWQGTWIWAAERGAPWGRLACWFLQQGVGCDRQVLEVLSRRDEHLGDAVISGLLLGQNQDLLRVLEAMPGVVLLEPGDSVPKTVRELSERPLLYVKLDPEADRAQVPSQPSHAALVFELLTHIVPEFGEQAAAVLMVDPAAHIGPRRVWMIDPIAEAEVVGTWRVEGPDGQQVSGVPLPDKIPVRAGTIPLQLPGIDGDSLGALLDELGLGEVASPSEEGEGVVFDADGVGRHPESWRSFLERVSAWIPEGYGTLTIWREKGVELMAALQRGQPVRWLSLSPEWPADQDNLELPLATEVQLLARALFQAPRSGRYLS